MSHPNAMSAWPDIRCERRCQRHISKRVTVSLGGPTPYHDYCPIPTRFARSFEMEIWDPKAHPVDGGPYCPAHDAVSETISALGIWEPRETTLALTVLSSAEPGSFMLDFGAQLGWFSLLAKSCGVRPLAFEADTHNAELLEENIGIDRVIRARIGPGTDPIMACPVRFAKLDLEGAENEAIRMLGPCIDAGLVDHMMIEISPVFADYYPAMVNDLVARGFACYRLPPKQIPSVTLENPEVDMEPYRIDTLGPEKLAEFIAGEAQQDCWFRRMGATW